MTKEQAIAYAERMGRELGWLGGQGKSVHTVVIRIYGDNYLARYAYEVACDDKRQVWDSATGEIPHEQPL